MPKIGGRPARIGTDDILRAGRELGMRGLSVKAVAARLGVTATALYRHVDGRWGLERLVGESILAELRLRDDSRHGLERHLLSFALQMRAFVLEHPGLVTYLQLLFPRGDGGRRLLNDEVDALVRRGYEPGAAIVLSGAVASLTIAMTASEEHSMAAEETDGDGLDRERQAVRDRLSRDDRLAEPSAALPEVPRPEYVRLVLTASIRGLIGSCPPGRPVVEMVADLAATGEGL
ncbi:TetR/AcrR family transcriptional regulator [Amycolatopsis sp. BJA-103]|uniref:TetR/AcrR family transcriptional regulator n=1 Tax=Amycolatopsis sp. BJA-103 TaxID=1911175 RepID=UPI000C75799D|nr:TetR/AcrR family transcriptional regulator [Amycolatopsis sp. BJA-103]AUI59729.1 TetR family transcriptional regulator [Amycolatopsis sp. BJA-103]PNE14556.1 TetR family transcriptional regulator [Amycolatopsis sp. BJA-103]